MNKVNEDFLDIEVDFETEDIIRINTYKCSCCNDYYYLEFADYLKYENLILSYCTACIEEGTTCN